MIIFRIFPIPAWVMLGLWFGIQLFAGFGTSGDMGGVAYWAHSGGFLAGLALTIPFWRTRGGTEFWQRTHGHPDHPEAKYGKSRIPKVRRRR